MTDASLFRAESPQAMRRDRSFGTLEAMLKPMPSTVPCSPTPHFNGWDESPASSVPPSPRAARWNNRSLFTKYQSPLRPTTFAMASPMPMMALAEAARRRALSTDTESSYVMSVSVDDTGAQLSNDAAPSPPKRPRFASRAPPVSPSPPAAPHSKLVSLLWS